MPAHGMQMGNSPQQSESLVNGHLEKRPHSFCNAAFTVGQSGKVVGRQRHDRSAPRPEPNASATARPASVSRQTSQSGLIGLENQGSAHPATIQARMVRGETSRPPSSKSGSLPPACSSPRRSHRNCTGVGKTVLPPPPSEAVRPPRSGDFTLRPDMALPP